MATPQEACHDGYAGSVAWLPGQRLSHGRQRQRVVDVRVAERIVGRHADVPGVMLLCPHSLQQSNTGLNIRKHGCLQYCLHAVSCFESKTWHLHARH